MKISKLFHSLYALLMLAPVFAVGGAMAFNIINDKAVDNAQNEDITYQKVNYQYETNVVNSFDDVINGNIYEFRFIVPDISSAVLDFRVNNTDTCLTAPDGFFNNCYIFYRYSLNGYTNSLITSCTTPTFNSNYVVYFIGAYQGFIDLGYVPLIFVVNDKSQLNYNPSYYTINSCPFEYIPYTLEEVTITYPDNLSDNFYYALDSMNNSDVFSWAKTSFLAEPFSYIFGLFGIPSGSPFITLLSYWLSISIIWLVFDLVMYVPLLVHGWIDKGGIE